MSENQSRSNGELPLKEAKNPRVRQTASPLIDLRALSREKPVFIAGPTASGKSALALEVAEVTGGLIVNADALQVYDGWNILTARPPAEDLARAPHALYGHVSYRDSYSAGQWQRDVLALLEQYPNPIIIGGTGLYFATLTQGMSDIPATPTSVRQAADAKRADDGLDALLADLDPETLARIDQQNPMRVQRAWEVQATTGRGLAAWQDETPPPPCPLDQVQAFVMDADRDWLGARIDRRFDAMIDAGALEEARAMEPDWDPARLSSKAIGAAELIAHLRGALNLEDAREKAKISTRQFAKRQRTWFRSKMKSWTSIPLR